MNCPEALEDDKSSDKDDCSTTPLEDTIRDSDDCPWALEDNELCDEAASLKLNIGEDAMELIGFVLEAVMLDTDESRDVEDCLDMEERTTSLSAIETPLKRIEELCADDRGALLMVKLALDCPKIEDPERLEEGEAWEIVETLDPTDGCEALSALLVILCGRRLISEASLALCDGSEMKDDIELMLD